MGAAAAAAARLAAGARSCNTSSPAPFSYKLGVSRLCSLLPSHPAAGLVATDSYSCDTATCQPPTCRCASNAPPGDLALEQVPQFVLISHDNALDALPYELMMRVLGNKTQPNGCPV